MRKPLFCRLGWHRSTFMDSAGFVGAMRCNLCLDWIDKEAGADVDAFRQAVSSGEITFKPDTSKCWESHDGIIQRAHEHATDGSIVPEEGEILVRLVDCKECGNAVAVKVGSTETVTNCSEHSGG